MTPRSPAIWKTAAWWKSLAERTLIAGAEFAGDVAHYWEDDGAGGGLVHSVQDVAPIIERNKAMFAHNDGYSESRELRRVAFIPNALLVKWQNEEGWNPWDPANAYKLAQKLNDGDYAHLRTAPGRLGVTNGGKTFR